MNNVNKIKDLTEYLEMYFEDNTMDDFLDDISVHPVDFVLKAYEAGVIDEVVLIMLLENDSDDFDSLSEGE